MMSLIVVREFRELTLSLFLLVTFSAGLWADECLLPPRKPLKVDSLCVFARAQSATVAAPNPPATNFLLARGAAGNFEIGMTVTNAYVVAGEQNVRLEAVFGLVGFQPELRIQLSGHQGGPALVAGITQSKCHEFILSWLEVYDARFRTKDGFGVGSILRDLKRRYPEADVRGLETDYGPVAYVKELGLTFTLQGTGPEIADSWRVSSVRVPALPASLWDRHCSDSR